MAMENPQTGAADQNNSPMGEEEKKGRRGAILWWILAVIALALLGGYVYIAYFQGKAAAAKEKIENAFVFRIDGVDAQGRKAAFDFVILTKDYTWVKGSTSEVVTGDVTIAPSEVVDRVITPQIRASLQSATDLIAVGLASKEGEQSEEEARADRRAQTIAGWLEQVAKPQTPILLLNLGQYRECKDQEDADTSFQRPLIFSAVRSKEVGTNLGEALANAISDKPNLPSRECYTKFDVRVVR